MPLFKDFLRRIIQDILIFYMMNIVNEILSNNIIISTIIRLFSQSNQKQQKNATKKVTFFYWFRLPQIGSLYSPLSTPPARCAAGTSSQTGSRWSPLSSDNQKQQKKHHRKGSAFFIGSGCLIRTGDQSVNSRLLYR